MVRRVGFESTTTRLTAIDFSCAQHRTALQSVRQAAGFIDRIAADQRIPVRGWALNRASTAAETLMAPRLTGHGADDIVRAPTRSHRV